MAGKAGAGRRAAGHKQWADKLEIERLGKEKRVLDLRKAGLSFSAIATEMGYAHFSSAQELYHSAIARVNVVEATEAKTLDLERLDVALAALYPRVVDGDVTAIAQWRLTIEARARIIGYAAPIRQIIDVIPERVIDAGLVEVAAEEAEMDAIERGRLMLGAKSRANTPASDGGSNGHHAPKS